MVGAAELRRSPGVVTRAPCTPRLWSRWRSVARWARCSAGPRRTPCPTAPGSRGPPSRSTSIGSLLLALLPAVRRDPSTAPARPGARARPARWLHDVLRVRRAGARSRRRRSTRAGPASTCSAPCGLPGRRTRGSLVGPAPVADDEVATHDRPAGRARRRGRAHRCATRSRTCSTTSCPSARLLVNVLGSTLLGFLPRGRAGEHAMALLGVGLLRRLHDVVVAGRAGARPRAVGGRRYLALTVALAMAGCALGFVVGAQA